MPALEAFTVSSNISMLSLNEGIPHILTRRGGIVHIRASPRKAYAAL